MPRPAKRSFKIDGHSTSISLEEPFWRALQSVAKDLGQPVAQLVQSIDKTRQGNDGLSSAIRVWLFEYVSSRAATTPPMARAIPREGTAALPDHDSEI